MCDTRATKSGLALDTQRKLESKYNPAEAAKAMDWVAKTLGMEMDTSGTMDSVYEQLKSGIVLIKLFSAICPDFKIRPCLLKEEKMPFKVMEKINFFIDRIQEPPLKIQNITVFKTVDLYERGNIGQVIACLAAVGRKCHAIDTKVAGYGPKESKGNKREFSQEQLAQGKTVIGLQMGSNKGASQSGQNFGKSRMITD